MKRKRIKEKEKQNHTSPQYTQTHKTCIALSASVLTSVVFSSDPDQTYIQSLRASSIASPA